jgi:hypothetical protein
VFLEAELSKSLRILDYSSSEYTERLNRISDLLFLSENLEKYFFSTGDFMNSAKICLK